MFLQAVLETVVKITHDKGKKNDTQETKYGEYTNYFMYLFQILFNFTGF